MGIARVIVAVVVVLLSIPLYGLLTNYKKARKIGLPILVTPVAAFHPIWWILGPLLFPILRRMPRPFSTWAYYGQPFWHFPDKNKSAEMYGAAWTIVTPTNILVNLHDAEAGNELLSRPKSFLKPPEIYEAVEFYGPNVDTVNGETWQRHRRLTTPPFNEKNSAQVWRESLGQAEDMLATWEEKGQDDGIGMSADTMKLALHVLSGAGFGKSYGFKTGMTAVPEGHSMSYRDALAAVLKNILLSMIVAKITAPMFLLPKILQNTRIAQAEFKKYMVEMVEEERALVSNGRPDQKENLMSVLVRANEASTTDGKERSSLSDEEIYGNLFIWNLAGHDTTANTLAYTISLLTVNMPVQEWLSEEINSVFGDRPCDHWDYAEDFPKLKRCLALMVRSQWPKS
jgi:cytochrome P450